MLKKRIHVAGARILVMGLTFKENCPDLRNTAVISIERELASYGAEVEVYDPWVKSDEARTSMTSGWWKGWSRADMTRWRPPWRTGSSAPLNPPRCAVAAGSRR